MRNEVISSLDIKINGTDLNFTECAKNLSLLMDSNLGFTEHITAVIKNVTLI